PTRSGDGVRQCRSSAGTTKPDGMRVGKRAGHEKGKVELARKPHLAPDAGGRDAWHASGKWVLQQQTGTRTFITRCMGTLVPMPPRHQTQLSHSVFPDVPVDRRTQRQTIAVGHQKLTARKTVARPACGR